MRNSPSLRLIERLSDYQVNIYAKNADIKQAVGANREYIDRVLNEYEPKIFDDPDEFLAESHTILCTNDDDYSELSRNLKSHTVVDPVGILSADATLGEYRTVSW
jgi:UDP-glucose 6-dehydrogenase